MWEYFKNIYSSKLENKEIDKFLDIKHTKIEKRIISRICNE
jgi:hypothetical protein